MSRHLTRKRILLTLALLALAGGGVWWYFSPRLTDEEKQFVGRWTWPVTYPNPPYKKPLHPPGSIHVYDLLPDRTARAAIFLPDGTQAHKTFAGKWRVENGELVFDYGDMYHDGFFGLLKSPPPVTTTRFPIVARHADRLELRPDVQVRPYFGEAATHVWTRNDAAPTPSGDPVTGKDLGF